MSRLLNAPQPLAADHILSEFECGQAALDTWLQRRAMANQSSGTSRSFGVADPEHRVFG